MTLTKRLFDGETSNLDMDAMTHLLSNSRRRAVLEVLSESETADLGSIAEAIAEMEEHSDKTEGRERAYIALHQCHAPKLDDHEVVDYDEDRKRVTVDENFGEVTEAKSALEKALK